MLAISPSVVAHNYLVAAVDCMNTKRFGEALQYLNANLSLTPYDAHAHWNRAVTLLALGHYRSALPDIEWRWKLWDHHWGLTQRDVEVINLLPRWKGQGGGHLLLYHEQGFGDAIMMLRYLPLLRTLARKVTLLTVQPLKRLAAQFGVDVIVRLPADFSQYDFRAALFDPMIILGHDRADIPKAPYIKVNWRRDPRKLGIAWSGISRKELSQAKFLDLLRPDGYELFALQLGCAGYGIRDLASDDFADTVDLMGELGGIVCVDTAVANLAGAIGHPNAHVVLPYLSDWRWYSPATWYPTLRLYQSPKPDDFDAPFRAIREALACNRDTLSAGGIT